MPATTRRSSNAAAADASEDGVSLVQSRPLPPLSRCAVFIAWVLLQAIVWILHTLSHGLRRSFHRFCHQNREQVSHAALLARNRLLQEENDDLRAVHADAVRQLIAFRAANIRLRRRSQHMRPTHHRTQSVIGIPSQ